MANRALIEFEDSLKKKTKLIQPKMSVSPQNSPINSLQRVRSSGSSDGEHETRSPISNCSETDQRPERMRDWLIRYAHAQHKTTKRMQTAVAS